MFYSFLVDQFEITGDDPVIAAFRYDPRKQMVTIIGDQKVVDRFSGVFNPKKGTVGWRLGKRSDEPLYMALGNAPGFRHYPKGEGQQEFLEALSSLEGKVTRNIPQKEESDG